MPGNNTKEVPCMLEYSVFPLLSAPAQYMEPENTPEINEIQIESDLITYSFVTVSLDHFVEV